MIFGVEAALKSVLSMDDAQQRGWYGFESVLHRILLYVHDLKRTENNFKTV